MIIKNRTFFKIRFFINFSITGESPDKNRDYDLFKQIDGFNDSLENNRSRLTSLSDNAKMLSGGEETSFISAVNNMARVLKSMIDNPYTAQNYVTDYYNNYTLRYEIHAA